MRGQSQAQLQAAQALAQAQAQAQVRIFPDLKIFHHCLQVQAQARYYSPPTLLHPGQEEQARPGSAASSHSDTSSSLHHSPGQVQGHHYGLQHGHEDFRGHTGFSPGLQFPGYPPFRPGFPPSLLTSYPHPTLHPLLRPPIPGLSPPATPGLHSPEAGPGPGYPQPPTPDSSNSRESDVFQFPGGEHQQGQGYLQTLLRQDSGQFQGLQENFLQQGRFQYPGTQAETEKTVQETEQERPRMHNGKKVRDSL